jgi:hypothetical protein
MSGIFGILGLADSDNSYVSTIGQSVVYDAVNALLAQYNDELNKAKTVFVQRTTDEFKFRYKLPGGGRLQERGGQAPSGDVKRYGAWDVAVPLKDFGAGLGGDRVTLAYMTLQELNAHLDTITIQDINTYRFELLRALFYSTQHTFVDPLKGSLTIEGLANGDSVVYPPVLGSETEATDNHYLGSAYLASAISDTNDPFVTIVDEIEEHFGAAQGGSNIVVFINNAQWAKTRALADVNEISDTYLRMGVNANIPTEIPANLPGTVRGRHNKGCWIVEYRAIPANYMLGIHLDAPKPLVERVDLVATGLPQGLNLVSQDEAYPLQGSQYCHRFGLAVCNRLNGVVMDMSNADSDYDIPTAFA